MPKTAIYDRRIAIKSVPAVTSATGAEIDGTPALFFNAWAAIEQEDVAGATEAFNAAKHYSQNRFRVRLRWRVDVLPTMQVHFANRVFDIIAIDQFQGRRRELVLTCREITTLATP